ncbi:hypothetical protein Riv7116_6458 [Rivularia sp. PCC 7116]|nr:hypothetical protein Riv7116_6458 [Rivularia sp. PCC 7116]
MLWKFVIATLVLPCCLGIETASAALKKDAQIPVQPEKLELLSAQSEEKANEVEAISTYAKLIVYSEPKFIRMFSTASTKAE